MLSLLSVIGLSSVVAEHSEEAIFRVRFGDKFGDGWDGASLGFVMREYNMSETYVVGNNDFRTAGMEQRSHPEIGDKGFEGGVECHDFEDAIYFAMVTGENNTLLDTDEPPVQSWEIYWQIEINNTVYHGGWNTRMAFTCDGNYTMLDWSENLLEPLTSCPECQHPKPKNKPKAKGSKSPRRLGGDDDHTKGKPKPPTKYWPVPIKLFDVIEKDGWFMPDNFGYAEYTISDASRVNLLAEGTLCAARGTDGYSTVCETMLPDGHYVFRASGNLDDHSTNYTWQLCGKEAIKYEIGMSDPVITGQDATMQYDYRTATGHMGNEVSFSIKKGKCTVDENVVTIDDYVNGTALDTVITLSGHFLLSNAHFNVLSSVESALLEADLAEFVNLEVEKTIAVTSVEDGDDGTLVGFRVVATHAESQFMHGTMDDVIDTATESLQTQMSGGGFVSFYQTALQHAGLSDDKLMSVSDVQFIDLSFDNMVTLHDGETMSGNIVAGGDHSSIFNPIVSGEVATHNQDSTSDLMLDVMTASGAFVVIALIVVAVVTALKPPAVAVSTIPELDNSSANLVKPEVVTFSDSDSLDNSSSQLVPPTEDFSYQDSLTAALSQRWEMNAEDDSVRL